MSLNPIGLGVLLVGTDRVPDPSLRQAIDELSPGRVRVETAEDTHRALAVLREGDFDGVIVVGTDSPESCAREVALLHNAAPATELVVIAPGCGPEGEVMLMESGAMELLSGPSAEPPELLRRLGWVLLRWDRYRELRQNESRFRTLTENISETVVVVGPDGTLRWATPSFEGLTGVAPAAAIGQNAFEFIHPEDRDSALDALTKIARNEELPGPSEFRALHSDGSNPWIEASGRNLLELPAVQGIVITMRDITERQALEAQLRDAQKMEAIGQLAGGIAHDFNNILTVLRGHSEFLLEHVTPGSPMHDELEAMRAATHRAASLTSRLLAFSRRQIMHPRLLDPAEVVLGMENMLSRVFSAKIETRVEIHDHGAIRADRGQLEQVLLNLALNAKDAMPEGGRLILRVRRARISASEAQRHPYRVVPGEYMVIEAEDTGHGMDEAVLSRVFEPFFTTKEVGSGTGLGLAMAYGVVKQSHGYVWADSTPGEGTSFRIYLPLVRP